MRFPPDGTRVRITEGDHVGRVGVIRGVSTLPVTARRYIISADVELDDNPGVLVSAKDVETVTEPEE